MKKGSECKVQPRYQRLFHEPPCLIDVTFATLFAKFEPQVGTGVCKKKAKILIERLSFRSPPPPPSSKLAGAAANSFTKFGLFFAVRRIHVDCDFNFELGGQGGRTAT